MITPHKMTWYEMIKAAGSTIPNYVRHEVNECFWQERELMAINQTGAANADKVNVFVPYVPNQYAFKKDDYIVLGIVADVIPEGGSPSLLTKKYKDCFKITRADRKEYKTALDHWHLGGGNG